MAESSEIDPDQKTQFIMRIHPDKKAKWEEYVGPDDEETTLAAFIRTAVRNHINDIESNQEIPNQVPDYGSELQEIKHDIERLKNDVSWLRNHFQDDSAISDIAQEVWNELEVLPDVSNFQVTDDAEDPVANRQQQAAIQFIEPRDDKDERKPQTAGALASRLDLEKNQVLEAIDHLKDQFLPIVEVELPQLERFPKEEDAHPLDEMVQTDIETHYFKEE